MNATVSAELDGAVLASIGRKRVRIALSDRDGALQAGTVRSYDAGAMTGVTAALIGFQSDLSLPRLPSRSAIAVAGLVRGDSISITHTRWFLSRSGLQAMLGKPPLILNDFAAEAWAICAANMRSDETFGGSVTPTLQQPGCYVVFGITSGFGVAVVNRSGSGTVTVLPTEAGHGVFAASTGELADIVIHLFPGRHQVAAEEIVSARGLVAIYNLLQKRRGSVAEAKAPEEVTRSASTDPIARAACELLAKAFWAQAGSLVMTFGAWDGVLLTGELANAIRPYLRHPEAQAIFVTSAKYQRVLQGVPRAFVTVENAELVGLAEALRHEQNC